MTNSHVQSLGHDILLCTDSGVAAEQLKGRYRFLDELWLPCPLADLTEEQIFVINRYRESVIEKESQYEFAARARRALEAVVTALDARQIIEIGCGKFPIDPKETNYLALDIDSEALSIVRQRGLAACHPSALTTELATAADLVISAYAMHFAISDEILTDLVRSTGREAIFCFNLIVDDAVAPIDLIARLAEHWPLMQVVKTPSMARREFFFVASRPVGSPRIGIAASAIRASFAEACLDPSVT